MGRDGPPSQVVGGDRTPERERRLKENLPEATPGGPILSKAISPARSSHFPEPRTHNPRMKEAGYGNPVGWLFVPDLSRPRFVPKLVGR
jgi:hypothetical protein